MKRLPNPKLHEAVLSNLSIFKARRVADELANKETQMATSATGRHPLAS